MDPGNNNYIVTIAKGQELGFKDFTPPYLAPTTSGPVILQGVNYASAGAGIFNETGFIFGGRINLDAQIDNFANTRQEIISSIGLTPALELLNKALFTLAMGSNDFLCNYLLPVTGAAKRKLISPEEFVEILISKYGLQLTRLYDLGARKIVVSNVGPIGCAPSQRDVNVDSCVESSNQIAKLFNTQLKRLVSELTSIEGSNFVYADVYHIVENILDSYASYGTNSG
ncbi:hypothetical protein TIFTF001_024271 [Ficus carica]|uniref:GDSL esterase/lipase n=1 Tax=Ficus carica TaxID=3494 RepID=A0AA88DD72_FICCA|nr:hypothetical protein TIFTF001_024271 [Ficus carica]